MFSSVLKAIEKSCGIYGWTVFKHYSLTISELNEKILLIIFKIICIRLKTKYILIIVVFKIFKIFSNK
jgi:hypothetical protein